MKDDDYIKCFACGAEGLNLEGECHKYMLSSPACWIMFNEVLEKEYSDLRYWKGHQYTVDAYACQHVGKKEDQRAINSVNIHLFSLYCLFELGLNQEEAPLMKSQFSQCYKGTNKLEWLSPPSSYGKLTIYEVWDNDDPELHQELSKEWAKSVWKSWSHQHKRIEELAKPINY